MKNMDFLGESRFHPLKAAVYLSLAITALPALASEVNVYSHRQQHLIMPLLQQFTHKTGIVANVRVATDNERLVNSIQAEGSGSKADILLTSDLFELMAAKQRGITQPVKSRMIRRSIPKAFRDDANHWFGLTYRGRFIFTREGSAAANEVAGYEDLANPKWQGEICLSNPNSRYNLDLVAYLISHKGEAYAQQWLEAVNANLAVPAGGVDKQAVGLMAAGRCSITLANSFYYAQMTHEQAAAQERQAAAISKVIIPTDAHIGLSGAMIPKHAPNQGNAVKLLDYLASQEAQDIYSTINFEFPVRGDVRPSKTLREIFPDFEGDDTPAEDIASNRLRAAELVNSINWK